MMGKQEQLDRIKKGDRLIKKMVKENKMGEELDKLVLKIIRYEELYLKRYGRDPNAQLKD
jgi:DNA-directed RNA polymerase subunit H (RpoH/RPB5)